MTKTCLRCKRLMPIGEFGPNSRMPDKRHYYCRKCANELARDRQTALLEKRVKGLYDGRCVICDGVENLEVVETVKMKRRNPKGMILICSTCKRDGIPEMTNYIRKCFRCGHVWIAKKTVTVVCPNPKCKSPYWHTPKKLVGSL